MEKLNIPAHYQKTTRQHDNTPSDKSPWDGLPYRPNPTCCVCQGAGFVHRRDGEAVDFGSAAPCRAPGCLSDSIRGNRPAELVQQTFETFQPVPGTEDALKYAKQLAYGDGKFIWLLIYGPPGNGKTHLCNAIVKEVHARGLEVRMVLTADLFSQLREAIEHKRADAVLRRFKDIFFLALDDYGVEYGSDWEGAKFDELMTSRFAMGKPTVLITNKEFADLPDRVRSRFNDNRLARAVHNAARDYRGAK